MPELPEVETITRNLRPELVGKKIKKANLLWTRTLATPTPAKFKKQIAGQKILAVTRRGKYINLQLSTFNLFVHLRMSGDLFIKEENAAPEKHDRLILTLAQSPPLEGRVPERVEGQGVREKKLVFNDTRKFGRVWLVRDPGEVVSGLGPEPLSEEFTAQMLYDGLQSRHRQLKPLLLDQSFLAGMGNIYTDEALHIARLHPLAPSNSVNREQAGALWEAVREVLQEGIRRNGASIDWVYRGGEFQNYFRVYDRAGQPCSVCGTAIERLVVGQRGTHICPNCQRNRS
jgi:formamidopyrimidine-DNA glycosylase